MSKIRAFIACDIPESILEKVSEVQGGLKELGADVAWTKVGGIHITLKFLGDVEEGIIDMVASVMEGAAKGQGAFDITVKGGGAFPSLKNPRVIWLGVEDEGKGLLNLQQGLDEGLKSLGFEPEEREFRPHLTLGRVKGPRGKLELSKAVSELREIDLGSFGIDRVILYRSDLKPTGAVYTKLKEVIFKKT